MNNWPQWVSGGLIVAGALNLWWMAWPAGLLLCALGAGAWIVLRR